MSNGTVEIPLSKKKIVLLLFGCVCFILAGIWLLTSPAAAGIIPEPIVVKILGISCILFFALSLAMWVIKLSDSYPGLIVDNKGIYNNTTVGSTCFVEWQHVTGFEIYQVKRSKILLVFIDNPKELIRASRSLSRPLLMLGYRIYGTPVSVVSTSLKCDFDTMTKTIQDFYKVSKVTRSH